MRFTSLLLGCAALALTACGQAENTVDKAAETTGNVIEQTAETVTEKVEQVAEKVDKEATLRAVLDAQPEDVKARYDDRNPGATLKFAGIEPGMTVAEVLPGGGWYSKIILPYLGDEGTLVGIDYSVPMWGNFGGFATEEFLEGRKTWADTWTADAMEWRDGNTAEVKAFAYGSKPSGMNNTVDVVLMVRAFHHLTRFDREFLGQALADTKAVLKKDGSVVIVQHRAPEGNPDDWANGDNGYVKQSEVIKIMNEAGFELVDESDINANPKDQPTADDMVWRLPPTLGTSRDDLELKAKMEAIGESDRMTLKFKLKG